MNQIDIQDAARERKDMLIIGGKTMDLGAYAKINDLSKIAEENGIDVPRLRGYRLMSEEKPLTEEEIKEEVTRTAHWIYEQMCQGIPRFSPHPRWYEYSRRTKAIMKKYLDENGNLRWNLIHGKKRKNVKFILKKWEKAIRKQYTVWNKYAGRADVLYIHARIGGGNWNSYRAEVENEPWFLEKVDDYFDSTYCDIYATIKLI